jgi:hypothetical protein
VYFILVLFFLTVTPATTKGQGNVAVSSHEALSGCVILVAVFDVLSLASVLASLLSLSLLPFLLLPLFPPLSPSPLP